jgi:threonine dehydrogenase-like Zn-dependent dehydrogenase
MVMGHEATGEIIDLGPGLEKSKLGTQVVMQPILTCGSCDQCRTGYAHRCRNRRFIGGTVSGALAERLTVPVSNLLPLPEGTSFVHGTLVEPLSVGLHAARQAGDLTGHSVLIAGSGPIGLCTMIAARRSGARAVVMTDIIPTRRNAAMALGADAALDPRQEDWRQKLVQVVGEQDVDIAFDAVGISPTFEQAVKTVRRGGAVVAIGGWRTVPIDLSYIVTHEIHLAGSFNYTPEEFDEARLWLGDGYLDPRSFLINTRPLAEGAAVFEEMVGNQPEAIKVVLMSDV